MTISPLALKAKKVIEAAWLHGPSFDLASQAAFALESVCMLQSPETAAESALSSDAVRVAEESVAELRREHEENARLRARVDELEAEQSVAYRASDGTRQLGLYSQREDALHHCENALTRAAGYSAATPFSWQERPDGTRELFAWTSQEVSSATGFRVTSLEIRPEFDDGWGEDADEPAEVSADRLTTLFAPSQVLREVPDGEHAVWVRRSYRTPHDLPETGGA